MNITITQDNSRVEQLGNGANIIKKLYDLAIDPNNTLTLEGNINSNSAYAQHVDYLNTTFGPDLVVTTNNKWILFQDSNMESALKNYLSINTGITIEQAASAVFNINCFKNNTSILSFNEFPYFTLANSNPPQSMFEGCSNLTSINLSNTTKISNRQFLYSGVTNINAPNLQEMGQYAVAGGGLQTITNLGSVTSIPNYCFYRCPQLRSAVIPLTVTSIEDSAFSAYNTNWTKQFVSISGLDNVTTYGHHAFNAQSNLPLNASILDNATSIGGEAFSNCTSLTGDLNLKKITTLGDGAFKETHIGKVLCLGKLSSVPTQSFFVWWTNNVNNQYLTEVYLPYECTSIGNAAFGRRSVLTTIKQYTQSIDNWVEGETPTYGDITRVTLFGEQCFQDCGSLVLSTSAIANATTIGANSFRGCTNLTGALNLPNLTSLGNAAFYQSGITSVTNLGSITTIGQSTFYGCSHLDNVTLPQSVTSIGETAFQNCSSLRYIIIPTSQTITFTGGRNFSNVPSSCIMYVDDNKVSEVVASNAAIGSGNFAGTIKGISNFATDFPNG